MTDYTREHLEIVNKAAQRNIPLEDVLLVVGWIEGGGKVTTNRGANSGNVESLPSRVRKAGKRGKLGKKIAVFLKSKCDAGAHVKDIAAAVKSKVANVTAWMYSTEKKSTKKVKPATFALVST